MVTQSALLHHDIPGPGLPAIILLRHQKIFTFVTPPEQSEDTQIFQEDNPKIYTNLENVFVHMIDEQDADIFKFKRDYINNQK